MVDQAIQEKQSIIVKAQGEARSAELIGEAVKTNKGFLQLRKLEAAREIAATLAQSGNRVMLDAKSLLLDGKSHLSSHESHVVVDALIVVTEDEVLNATLRK